MPRPPGPGASIIPATILLALAAAWGCDAPTAGQDGGPDGRMDAGSEPGSDAGGDAGRDAGPADSGVSVDASPDASDPCDMDGDGRSACAGEDCDDTDPNRYRGNTEVCDAEGHDEDCEISTLGPLDADGDGVVSSACCNLGLDGVSRCGLDCDDSSTATYTDAPELCDGHDNDCDGMVDEDVMLPFYVDADGDGFGAMGSTPAMACAQPAGHSANQTDCRDDDAAIHPAAVEACDLIDNDCDGDIDPGCDCTNGAEMSCGMSDVAPCRLGTMLCVDGRWGPCVGNIDPSFTCYPDADGDGYARASAVGVLGCTACADRDGFTHRAPTGSTIDCNDGDVQTYPGAPERCNRLDDDCSNTGSSRAEPAEDRDDDGYKPVGYTACSGGPLQAGDCDDADRRAHPGQTEFFTTGRCHDGQGTCHCSDGTIRCFTGFAACALLCRPGTSPPSRTSLSFDFDCDGASTRFTSPVDNCNCSPDFGVGCCALAATDDAICGQSTTYSPCNRFAAAACGGTLSESVAARRACR